MNLPDVVALAKRRGFAYPSSEIYGGVANTWDFGPVGTLLKNNIRDFWWKTFVLDRDDMVGVDASIFLSPKVWEASGHVANFTDVMVEDTVTHRRYRADHLIEEHFEKLGKEIKVDGMTAEQLQEIIDKENIVSPEGNPLTKARRFNLLFETKIGIVEESQSKAYLRGEIAQGIFLNFKNVLDTTRVKIPFGIAQQGKAFRNEITMGQFVHRTLEFDLMEFEYFVHPSKWEETYEKFRAYMWQWALDLGIREEHLRWREHEAFERSHYSKRTMDIEYKYPFGWKEMFGIAYRTDFDLSNHAKHSGHDLSYFDQTTGERYIPHVIEPTFGLSRLIGVVLADAYRVDEHNGTTRTYLALSPKIAPYKAAIFPLLANKEDLVKKARDIYENLKKHFVVTFDSRGNIGKRYLSQDEIGTPFCITIDFDTLADDTVTVRDRNTTTQHRLKLSELDAFIRKHVSS